MDRIPTFRPTVDAAEARLWAVRPVLDKGFVRLVDYMGGDASITQAARISYGAGTKSVSEDETLIRYLLRNQHTSPFEMCESKWHIRIPMDAWRQMVRHRMASINEYSTRYSEAIDDRQETGVGEWRSQSVANKQGSGLTLSEWPPAFTLRHNYVLENWEIYTTIEGVSHRVCDPIPGAADRMPSPGECLTHLERLHHGESTNLYNFRLMLGVAREQARKDLPLSTYTEVYWKIDLHNLMHFLRLRMDSHAQLEIRSYANAIAEVVAEWVPMTWRAFQDYRLDALSLSGPEVRAIARHAGLSAERIAKILEGVRADKAIVNKREHKEFAGKLSRLASDPNLAAE